MFIPICSLSPETLNGEDIPLATGMNHMTASRVHPSAGDHAVPVAEWRPLRGGFDERKDGQCYDVKSDRVGTKVPRKNVETRASGRPPEEAGSDDPEAQAQAILEDSEDRKNRRADLAEGGDEA
jgi:hypothetical protein